VAGVAVAVVVMLGNGELTADISFDYVWTLVGGCALR